MNTTTNYVATTKPFSWLGSFDESVVPGRSRSLGYRLDTPYAKVALWWLGLGFNVVPGRAKDEGPRKEDKKAKTPHVTFTEWSGTNPQRLDPEKIGEWAEKWPDATPLLLLDSNPSCRLVVLDADSPTMSPWIDAEYGVSPYQVSTGRVGGGRHHYYRAPKDAPLPQKNKVIGPDVITWGYTLDKATGKVTKAKGWGMTEVDVKSSRSYAVAPGATHASGKVYTSNVDPKLIDSAFLAALPALNMTTYKRHIEESIQRKQSHQEIISKAVRALLPKLPQAARVALTGTVKGLEAEPFVKWCKDNPTEVTLNLWWGLASNLAAHLGEGGRVQFDSISARDTSRYTTTYTDFTYTRALASSFGPTGYVSLRNNGYTGAIPEGSKNPAAYLKHLAEVAAQTKEDRLLAKEMAVEAEEAIEARTYLIEKYGHRVEARKAKAKAYDPHVLKLAVTAEKHARYLMVSTRRAWSEEGFSAKHERCGTLTQILGDLRTGEGMVLARRCGRLDCAFCGPLRMGRLAASLVRIPLLNAEGNVIGLSLGRRTLYKHEIAKKKLQGFLIRWRRKTSDDRKNRKGTTTGGTVFSITGDEGYPAYLVADPESKAGTITILTTNNMGGTKVAPDNAEQVLLTLVKATHSVDMSDPLGIVNILGKIKTSHGVVGNPESLAKLANVSSIVVERTRGIVAPVEAAKRLSKKNITVNGNPDVTYISNALPGQKREELWDTLEEEHAPPQPVDEVLLDDLLDDLLETPKQPEAPSAPETPKAKPEPWFRIAAREHRAEEVLKEALRWDPNHTATTVAELDHNLIQVTMMNIQGGTP